MNPYVSVVSKHWIPSNMSHTDCFVQNDVHFCVQFITDNLHHSYDKYSRSEISRSQAVVPFLDDQNNIVLNFL